MNYSQLLRDFIKESNVTVAEMARWCGINRSQLYYYMHNERKVKIEEELRIRSLVEEAGYEIELMLVKKEKK